MNSLCTRLRDVNEAGVYQLSCSMEELRVLSAEAGFLLFEVALAQVHGKGEWLAAVAQSLKAPLWFGHNWDALADALTDLSWADASEKPSAGYVLLLCDGGETLGLTVADHQLLREILTATVAYWKSQGRAFWIFFC